MYIIPKKKSPKTLIEGWFDGCCEPRNPGGSAAYGALLKVDGVYRWSAGVFVGAGDPMSNNVAEYSGCVAVMEQIEKLYDSGVRGKVIIRGDSKLVIGHLHGFNGKKWKMNGGRYLPIYQAALPLYRRLVEKFGKKNFKMEWIPREKNDECDVLSKQILLDRGVEFRIQPV